MNINYKQPQFELFPQQSSGNHESEKPKYLLAQMTLTIENLVVLSILCIMLSVFSFTLGVERGKRLAVLDVRTAVELPVVAVEKAVKTSVPQAPNALTTVTTQPKQEIQVQETVIEQPATVEQQAPKSIPQDGYTIQVASFKNLRHAQQEAMALKKRGYESYVMEKGKYTIVCVGRFDEKERAGAYLSTLKKQYKDSLVRRF